MTKITKNFSDKEVLPRELHGYRWEWFIDFRIVEVAQKLRDIFGPITINNDRFNWSGYRTADCGVGAQFSQHRFGRALDLKFANTTPEEVQKYIIEHESEFMDLGLRRMENAAKTKTWLHIDCMHTGKEKIIIFNP
jgi:hypothetical protein